MILIAPNFHLFFADLNKILKGNISPWKIPSSEDYREEKIENTKSYLLLY